jgi:tape measure domain-containing protein
MPEYFLTLKLDDQEFGVKIIADSEKVEELRKKFETGGIAIGRTISDLRERQKSLNELFERSEIGSDEYKKLKAEIDKTTSALKQAENGVEDIGNKSKSLPEQFAQWGNIITGINQGLQVAEKLYNILSKPIDVAGQFEQLNVQFEVLLGSQEKAIKLVSDIQTLGASTPLELMDLQTNAKLLLNFGIAGDQVIDTLRMLGDISGGDKERLSQLTLAFSQMSSTGRLMGQDLLQMINAGFNPLKVISEETGKSMGTLKKEMEAGAITSDMVTDAFKKATSEGGQFYNMMEKQSKTYEGMVSNLEDSITMMEQGLGTILLPVAESTVDTITSITRSLTPVKTNVDRVTESAEQQRQAFELLIVQYEELRNKVNKNNDENEKYNSIINTLQSKYPEMFKNLDLHKEKIEKVRDAFKQTREAIEQSIRAELKQAELQDLVRKQMDIESQKRTVILEEQNNEARLNRIAAGTLQDTYETISSKASGQGPRSVKLSDSLKDDIKSNETYLAKLKIQWDDLEAQKEKIFADGGKLPDTVNSPKKTPTGPGDLDFQKKKKKEMIELEKEEQAQLEKDAYTLYNYLELTEERALKETELATIIEKIRDAKTEKDLERFKADKEMAEKSIQLIDEQTKAWVADHDAKYKLWQEQREADSKAHINAYNANEAEAKKIIDLGKARADAVNEQYAKEYALLDVWKSEELKKYEDIKEAQTIIDEIYASRKAEIDKKVSGKELDIASQTVGSLAQLMGRQTAAYKVLATAQAIMDTYKAANVALASAPPPWNFIAMAGVIATGLTNVMAIEKTDTSMKGFVRGGIVVGEKGPEIIAPMQDYASGQAQLVSEAVLAVERKLTSLNFEIGSSGGRSNNNEVLDGINRMNKNIEKLFNTPPQITEDACAKIFEVGRRAAGYTA